MGKASKLQISESINELNERLKLQAKHKNIDRIRAFIYLKESTFSSRELLSDHLRISLRTLEPSQNQHLIILVGIQQTMTAPL